MSDAALPDAPQATLPEAPRHTVHLAHHFDDLAQQREADTLGMWAFLATEVMFFGAVFLAFAVYRFSYPRPFAEAAHHLKMWMGAINTGVLLCSSFTVALSVHHAQEGDRKKLVRFLLLTIALGAAFLCIKAFEYYLEYREHLVPGINYHYGHEPNQTLHYAGPVRIFFSFYFIMTAIHATHMIIGLVIFGIIAVQAQRGRYSPDYYNSVEISGLYWHFVDLVWIFLFPLLYLLRY
jgi:cytochrome c oxidase subunit III